MDLETGATATAGPTRLIESFAVKFEPEFRLHGLGLDVVWDLSWVGPVQTPSGPSVVLGVYCHIPSPGHADGICQRTFLIPITIPDAQIGPAVKAVCEEMVKARADAITATTTSLNGHHPRPDGGFPPGLMHP